MPETDLYEKNTDFFYKDQPLPLYTSEPQLPPYDLVHQPPSYDLEPQISPPPYECEEIPFGIEEYPPALNRSQRFLLIVSLFGVVVVSAYVIGFILKFAKLL